jgi:hypothetical protein
MYIGNTVAARLLESLRANVERVSNGWGEVYLDNAKPAEMSVHRFRANLAVLSKLGLYRVVDGYAFGDVKMKDED